MSAGDDVSARTQSKRLWLGGGAVVAVVIVLIGWFGVIGPELSAAAATRDQADSARMQNVTLQAKNTKLKEQNDDVATLRASLANALAALPSDGGLPEFTRQISAQATSTSVVLTSIVVAAAAPVAAATAATGTDSTDTRGTTTTGATSAPTAGLLQIAITVKATGLGDDLQAFLNEVQATGPRRALVIAVQLSPGGENGGNGGNGGNGEDTKGLCTLNLSLNIFSAPLSPDAQAALEKLLSGN
jgi:hypothetical protein